MSVGLEFESFPGLIPKFDEMAACRFNNYRYYHDWQELSGSQKAELVAFYYLNVLVENHKRDAEAEEIRRRVRDKK